MENVRKFTQAYSQAPWRKQMQVIGLFLLLLVVAALVAGIYLSVTARAATMGREILLMQTEIEELKMAIVDRESQLAALNSMEVMQARAEGMGFKPIEKGQAMFLEVPGYVRPQSVVLAPQPAPVTAVSASLPPDFTVSLVDWLRQRISLPEVNPVEVQP